MSITELYGILSTANLKAGEVGAAVAEMIPTIQNCVQDLADIIGLDAQALGDSNAESVSMALGHFQQTQNRLQSILATLEQAQNSIYGGIEANADYMSRLMS